MKPTLTTLPFVLILFFTLISPTLAVEDKPTKAVSANATIPAASVIVYGSASQDAYPQEGFPDTPTGNQQNLYLGYDSLYNKQKTQIYTQFNLPSLPAGATLISAKVEVYQYIAEATSNYGLSAYPVDCDWGEYTLTWNNRPCNSASMGSASFSPAIGWKSVDITDMAREWYNGTRTNRGLKLQAHDQSAPGGIFRSRECDASQCPGGEHPRLRIEYELDNVSPTGNVTSPADNTRTGVGIIHISANASDNAGGSGVKHVQFKALYDGKWHNISTDASSPYSVDWQTPAGLRTQVIRLGINVADNAGNIATDAGGTRIINFVESDNNPTVKERVVTLDRRRSNYLNQRSLSPYGDSKCGASSAAMVLAMNGAIPRGYNSLRDTANAIYPKTIKDGSIYAYLVAAQIQARSNDNLNARARNYPNITDGWVKIKDEIKANRPVILLSWKVTAGHFFVVVGYRQDSTSRQIIVYDPYGQWTGKCKGCYLKNTPNDPGSHIGKYKYYSFDAVWGGYLITAQPTNQKSSLSTLDDAETFIDFPEEMADDSGVVEEMYEGVDINTDQIVYLPIIIK